MPRIELSQLLKPTTTPEQEIFLTWFYATFDNRSAINRQIINVEPLFYEGFIAGTEFLTYAATKLYLAYFLGNYNGGETAFDCNLNIYNEGDAFILGTGNNGLTTTPRYYGNPMELTNFYFSRFVSYRYSFMIFNGYRITLQ